MVRKVGDTFSGVGPILKRISKPVAPVAQPCFGDGCEEEQKEEEEGDDDEEEEEKGLSGRGNKPRRSRIRGLRYRNFLIQAPSIPSCLPPLPTEGSCQETTLECH